MTAPTRKGDAILLLVYGSFSYRSDRGQSLNFFHVRLPHGWRGRTVNLSRAVDKYVRTLYSPEDLRESILCRRMRSEDPISWNWDHADKAHPGARLLTWDHVGRTLSTEGGGV